MTPDLLTLAASVVALPGWRWMPGMLSNHGARYLGGGLWIDASSAGAVFADPNQGEVPDLTDAATGGCMLAMLGPCRVWIDSEGDAWMQEAGLDPEPFRTLAEACARVALARGRWA